MGPSHAGRVKWDNTAHKDYRKMLENSDKYVCQLLDFDFFNRSSFIVFNLNNLVVNIYLKN